MENLKSMKQCLIAQAQAQMGNLQQVDAEELGEVIDMIKDIEEAIYYCTITKAMEKSETENPMYYTQRMPYYEDERDMDRRMGRMYYSSGGGKGGGMSNGNSSSSSGNGNGQSYYTERELPVEFRDEREGRSPMRRKMYMESKEMRLDKSKQLKELEKYLQELSLDIIEIIEDASPEEKRILQDKIATLANKVNV